ncbi:hypothetical protein ABBQ38_007506 [Trebouxia sp. C0009 RCD-2024]
MALRMCSTYVQCCGLASFAMLQTGSLLHSQGFTSSLCNDWLPGDGDQIYSNVEAGLPADVDEEGTPRRKGTRNKLRKAFNVFQYMHCSPVKQ